MSEHKIMLLVKVDHNNGSLGLPAHTASIINDRDREVVERACGEIDRSASSFLPNLKPGEAAVIGADFPIPLTIQIAPPEAKPISDGPDYQRHWKL